MAESVSNHVVGLLTLIATPVLILLASYFAVRHYVPLRWTPIYVSASIFVALVTSASAIFLVPLDVGSTDKSNYEWMVTVPRDVLLVLWRSIYWITFALTWIILPLLGEAVGSGFHHAADKFIYSVRSVLMYYFFVLLAAVVAAIYFVIGAAFDFGSFKALVMAGSYGWGLVLACCLLGYGLVSLPRHYYSAAHQTRRLEVFKTRLQVVDNDLIKKRADFVTKAGRAIVMLDGLAFQHPTADGWEDEIRDCAIIPGMESPVMAAVDAVSNTPLGSMLRKLTKPEVARATQELIRMGSLLKGQERKRRRIEDGIFYLERSVKVYVPGDKRIPMFAGFREPLFRGRLLFRFHVASGIRWIVAAALSTLSAIILLSQMIALFDPSITLVSVLTNRFQIHWLFPVLMLHSAVCAVSALPRIPLAFWRARSLTPGATANEPAIWFASQVARLAVPLALNYSSLLPRQVYRNMVFYDFLGSQVDLTPFGVVFARTAPLAMVVIGAALAIGKTIASVGFFVKAIAATGSLAESPTKRTLPFTAGGQTSGGDVGRYTDDQDISSLTVGDTAGYVGFESQGVEPPTTGTQPAPQRGHRWSGRGERSILDYRAMVSARERMPVTPVQEETWLRGVFRQASNTAENGVNVVWRVFSSAPGAAESGEIADERGLGRIRLPDQTGPQPSILSRITGLWS